MTYTELYQSVLQKLGQVPADNLVAVDAFLEALVKEAPHKKPQNARQVVRSLAGAWKDWDDKDFEAFLNHTLTIRQSLFTDRKFDL